MPPLSLTSWLYLTQLIGNFSDTYAVKKTGVTYKIQFETPQKNNIKGTFKANGLTFHLNGTLLENTASGEIKGEQKLSFEARFQGDKLHFDIYKTDEDGKFIPNLGQLLVLDKTVDEEKSRAVHKQ